MACSACQGGKVYPFVLIASSFLRFCVLMIVGIGVHVGGQRGLLIVTSHIPRCEFRFATFVGV